MDSYVKSETLRKDHGMKGRTLKKPESCDSSKVDDQRQAVFFCEHSL